MKLKINSYSINSTVHRGFLAFLELRRSFFSKITSSEELKPNENVTVCT